MIVYVDTLKRWYPPFQSEKIGVENRIEIIDRVSEVLDYAGVDYEIE